MMPEDDGADIIISGGRLHHVEEVPTTNVSAKDMDNFLKEHADRMRKEKDDVAARAYANEQINKQKVAFTIPKTASSPIKMPATMAINLPAAAAATPSADAAETSVAADATETKRRTRADMAAATLAVMAKASPSPKLEQEAEPAAEPAAAPKEDEMPESIANPSTGSNEPASGRRPSRRGESSSSASRRAAPKPKKKTTSIEKWLYWFIAICVIAGGLNFYLRKKPVEEKAPVVAPVKLAATDQIWLAAETEAGPAEVLTKQASAENRDGSKDKATEMYKQAADLWYKVFEKVDQLRELGIDFDAPGYEKWQRKITAWTASMHECLKFQTLGDDDEWDFDAELQKARERNRLDPEEE